MSDAKDADEHKPLTLARGAAAPGKLGLRKTVETGQVRQSFSHGRSKAVTVEVKKRRVIGPGEAPPPPPTAPVRPAPVAVRPAPPPPLPPRPAPAPPPAARVMPAAPEPRPAPPPAPPPAPVEAKVETPPPAAPPPPALPAPEPVAAAPAEPVAAPPPAPRPSPPPAPPSAPAARVTARAAPPGRTAAPAPTGRAAPPPPAARPTTAATQARGRGGVVLRTLTDDEKASRARALGEHRTADAEARRRAQEDEVRRAAEQARLDVEREAAARRQAEEDARKKGEEEMRRRGEQEADRRLRPVEGTEGSGTPAARAALRTEADREAEEAARQKRLKDAKRAQTTPARRNEPRRRTGRITVTQALTDEERWRSVAAMRRQAARERRLAQGEQAAPEKIIRDVVIPEAITVGELANRMAVRGADVVRSLMKMGVMATITQSIDTDTAELIVAEFGHKARRVSESDVEIGVIGAADQEEAKERRPAIVTVMGHVDHGKTSLLDAIRSADVAAGEAGGITQHIGAYQVVAPNGQKITFLDTPGHAAFTSMRARGAKVTDIVVLVVAADDGIMPQTVEAISHAKAANVPIIVAINKVDRADANPNKVRQGLLQHEIVVEQMGGDVLDVEVSATKKTNIDKLLESIQLQAEILDLKANPNRPGEGAVIEAKLDRGRGPVATVLVQRGTLKLGDIFVTGSEWGRVRAMVDDQGKSVSSAGPSVPVEVLGLQGVPEAGDDFNVVENDARAREVSDFRQRRTRDRRVATAPVNLEQMFTKAKDGGMKELPVVVKADVQGSVEAIVSAITKLAGDSTEVGVRVLHSGVGGLTESDVDLARASQALIIAFNVRPNKQARDMAERDAVTIRYHTIIYDLIDDVKTALTGMLRPMVREIPIGAAQVLQVFTISKVGKIAGCRVTEGAARRGVKMRQTRDNIVLHTGLVKSLKRFKDDVREVREGNECGMAFEAWQDIQQGDTLEFFEEQEVVRTL
jgi:translation initiation factor IF-2